jgi:hypothetical protein
MGVSWNIWSLIPGLSIPGSVTKLGYFYPGMAALRWLTIVLLSNRTHHFCVWLWISGPH